MRTYCWFNDKSYLSYQATNRNCSVSYFMAHNQAVSLPLVQCENALQNPFMAPYGGFISAPPPAHPVLKDYLQCIEQAKQQHPTKSVILRPYPFFENQNCPTVVVAKHLNIAPLYTDTTYAIRLNQPNPQAYFINHLHRGARHKLNKCQKAGYVFKQLSVKNLEAAYHLLQTNRASKGYPLTLGFDSLKQLFINFENRYELFGVYDNHLLISTAVVVNVNKALKYTLYLGHLPDFSAYSPVVFLITNLVTLATTQNTQLIDLGTATHKGTENKGLANFKKSLGAKPYALPTYVF